MIVIAETVNCKNNPLLPPPSTLPPKNWIAYKDS